MARIRQGSQAGRLARQRHRPGRRYIYLYCKPPSTETNKHLLIGYKEYDTGRTYMAKMGDWREDKDVEIPLDGIGGVNILVKADVHRSGINFPSYAFENQAETEGFAKMAKRAGYGVYGLPNYIVWHIDTDEKPGNA